MDGKSAVLMACVLFGFSMPIARADTPSLAISGFSGFEFGQIIQGYDSYLGKEIQHQWMQNLRGGITLNSHVTNKLSAIVSLEVQYRNFYPMLTSYPSSEQLDFLVYPHQIEAIFSLKEQNSPLLIGVGYFPYKYCAHARNLGEYLFRSGTYPPYVNTEFDAPFERLMGLHVESELGLFKQSLLLTSSTNYPLYDYSLSYLGSLNVPRILNIGLGAGLHRFFSVDDPGRTTPRSSFNGYKYIDGADTLEYTFKGVKLMGHFSFDPKGFFPNNIFGPEDLVLYGEGAVLGYQNYPMSVDSVFAGYEKLNERIPLMMGFNFPAFKLLDVLAVEAEWFPSKFSSSLENIYMKNVPLPDQNVKNNYLDDWKWSVYARKTFTKRYSVTIQVANDHLRLNAHDVMHHQLWEEILQKPGDLWYMIKQRIDF